jgi:hypothetical protein
MVTKVYRRRMVVYAEFEPAAPIRWGRKVILCYLKMISHHVEHLRDFFQVAAHAFQLYAKRSKMCSVK